MTRDSNQVLDAALRLTPKERAEVVAKLLATLDGDDDDVEAAWAAEIERRARRVLAGEGEFEDWEDIRDGLRPSS
jgi:putative addiction module component (TIGR02574 family)